MQFVWHLLKPAGANPGLPTFTPVLHHPPVATLMKLAGEPEGAGAKKNCFTMPSRLIMAPWWIEAAAKNKIAATNPTLIT